MLYGDAHHSRTVGASRTASLSVSIMSAHKIPDSRPIRNAFLCLVVALQAACATSANENTRPSPEKTPTEAEQRKQDLQDSLETNRKSFREEMDELNSKIKESPELARAIAASSAVTDWKKTLVSSARPYSVDLTEAMVLPNRRPIVFLARLEDIASDGGKYFVRFRHTWGFTKIRFILESDAQQVGQMRGAARGLPDDFAVIATITSVDRLRFKVDAIPMGEAEDAAAETEVESSNLFVASGRCLSAINVTGK